MDVIKVKDVWKKYKIYHDKGSTLKERILFKNRNRYEERWALKGIDLDIKKGETVGLIGENGSGKSTLLKLLTKIIYPNKGEIEIKGKVSSLLELGAGFHPDMTGRENIYMNASIFGLTKEEIDKKLDDIISFSGLEDFIDNPVRTYSSGMYMRLAFSVAINVDADILLIDEVLAVGDTSFQKKCIEKMVELKNKGVTIVFVSHDNNMVKRLCDKAIWLKNGNIASQGIVKDVINNYLDHLNTKSNIKCTEDSKNEINSTNNQVISEREVSIEKEEVKDIKPANKNKRWGNKYVEILQVDMFDKDNKSKHIFISGETVRISIKYKVNKKVDDVVFGIGIFRDDEVCCYGTNTFIDNYKIDKLTGRIDVEIDNLNLITGKYYLDVAVHDKFGLPYDYIKKILSFNVETRTEEIGVVRLAHKWHIL
ncbi:ABC transporter ATP-binding protein [Thermohalobacter berrensis]|uniref:Sugar ABC transporter ATP-binding protein n=1 Tax=Thermohalobacter berrensis TaxID=99594 RepID=A0A419T3Z2_9FIRM|nr:ABC transporter ATP-binding protein [Thermohalobacter berrensis]RKD32270.1 sugar ABC transporter ATP-binding protein [Thermohalobacter berrensis]